MDGSMVSNMSEFSPQIKRQRMTPPLSERVMLYVRQDNDDVYTPLHVVPPSTVGLLNAVSWQLRVTSVTHTQPNPHKKKTWKLKILFRISKSNNIQFAPKQPAPIYNSVSVFAYTLVLNVTANCDWIQKTRREKGPHSCQTLETPKWQLSVHFPDRTKTNWQQNRKYLRQ